MGPTEEEYKITIGINKLRSTDQTKGQQQTREQGQSDKGGEEREQNQDGKTGQEKYRKIPQTLETGERHP